MKLPKVYEPQLYEKDIYALWEKSRAFVPVGDKSRTGENFSIVVPPPNANGNLHLGHALTLGLEDIAIRYHRLKGDNTLLLPGADHAGFETQVVYEKQLIKEGKSRFDFFPSSHFGKCLDRPADAQSRKLREREACSNVHLTSCRSALVQSIQDRVDEMSTFARSEFSAQTDPFCNGNGRRNFLIVKKFKYTES